MKNFRIDQIKQEQEKVLNVLYNAPEIDPYKFIRLDEFQNRQKKVWKTIKDMEFDAGFVFSNEHFCGDVPYLAGNTNITIEQVAGVIGPNGFHVITGFEGGYTVEQLAHRSGAIVHKVELLQLEGCDYPIDGERPEDVFLAACGELPKRIAILTPRDVIPIKIYDFLETTFGKENLIDASKIYSSIKYEKSNGEVSLTKDSAAISDTALRAMLAVLKPGMRETQVAAWGNYVLHELGAEQLGFDTMVTSNEANRTLIGKALNRIIEPNDMVHLGVSAQRDGLTSCVRRSVVAVEYGQSMPSEHRFWLDILNDAYRVAEQQLIIASRENLPSSTIEKALVDYLESLSTSVSKKLGKSISLVNQKPYTCMHSSGYTECLEFIGAVTLETHEPLGNQIISMLDVALRGIGDTWNDVIIPGFDFAVVENTFWKNGPDITCLDNVPIDCQDLVGTGI